MRRSASEIINELEGRIARLENQVGTNKSAKLTLEKELRDLNDHLKSINKMIKAYEVFEDVSITMGAFFNQDLASYIGNSNIDSQYKFYDGINFFEDSDNTLDGFLEVLEKTKKELEKEIKELKRNPPTYV